MMSILLSLVLAAAGGATGADAAQASVSTQSAKPTKTKKICEKVDMTGSSVPKRVCRTVVEPAQPSGESERADAGKPNRDATN